MTAINYDIFREDQKNTSKVYHGTTKTQIIKKQPKKKAKMEVLLQD